MSFQGVNPQKVNGGLGGENPTNDAVMALVYVVPSASLPAGITHYTPYELLLPKNADTLGFVSALDASADILLRNEIEEFFRLAPDAILHVIPVPASLTPVQILGATAFRTALRTAKDVKSIGVAGTTETLVSMYPLVEGIQAIIDGWATEHRLIDAVIVAGKGTATATALSAYPDYRDKVAPNVSISIAQDPAVAALDTAYAKYASIGAVLGMLAVRQVDECIGSVDIARKPNAKLANRDYPLTGPTQFLKASLSDGTPVETLSLVEMKALTTKGYIVAGSFEGYAGIFFDLAPTCVEKESDFCYIERNRTWNKGARLIREALLPKVKGRVKKDPATGYIRSTTITSWENTVAKALGRMEVAEEISGLSVYINPKQIPTEENPIVVNASLVINGVAYEFNVPLGLVNSLGS